MGIPAGQRAKAALICSFSLQRGKEVAVTFLLTWVCLSCFVPWLALKLDPVLSQEPGLQKKADRPGAAVGGNTSYLRGLGTPDSGSQGQGLPWGGRS